MRLITKEHKIGKLHEPSVQSFVKDHLNEAICSLTSSKSNI